MTPLITILIFFTLLFPFITKAQVAINEIMYDLPGSDENGEWIELLNTGTSSVDISRYKLNENDTNHTLKIFQGTTTIPALGFAIIARKATSFLSNVENFNVPVFESSFSLSNTGEVVTLKNANLNNISSVNYSSSLGGNGDGQSLQLISSRWVATQPTPGTINKESKPLVLDTKQASVIGTPKIIKKEPYSKNIGYKGNTTTSSGIKNLSEPLKVEELVVGESNDRHNTTKWFLALAAIIIVASTGAVIFRRTKKTPIDEIEIIE